MADHPWEYAAADDAPGTNVVSIDLEWGHLDRVKAGIRSVRARGADLIVVSTHWGPNMRQEPTPEYVTFARAVMDAGADVFHGHSAHVFQGVEIYRGKLILYDTGDLIDDYWVDRTLRNDQQLLYLVHASRAGVQRVELVPLRIDRMQVNLARGRDVAMIQERITRLSAPFGTTMARHGDRLVIDLR